MCSLWFGLLQKPHFLCQNSKDLPALLEYYPCAIAKVYVDERFQFIVDGDSELGRHCGKGEYVFKGLLSLKKLQKVTILELRCGHSLGVHHFCMP